MACLPTMARIRADLQATAGMLYIIVLRQMWRWRAAGDDWARHVPGAYESHASSLDAHANPPPRVVFPRHCLHVPDADCRTRQAWLLRRLHKTLLYQGRLNYPSCVRLTALA